MKVADLLEQVRSALHIRDINAAIGRGRKRKSVSGTDTVGKSVLRHLSVQSQCCELFFLLVKTNSKHHDLSNYNECHSGDSPYSFNMSTSSWEWRKKYKPKREKEKKILCL